MQFTTLFCLVGRDNGQRFASISGLVFFVLLLAAVVSDSASVLYIVGLLLAPILALTSLRRLRDTGKSSKLAALTLAPWVLIMLTLAHIDSVMLLITLMLFAGLAIGYVAMLPAISVSHYKQGYSGPIDISANVTVNNARVRVEPTLSDAKSDVDAHSAAFVDPTAGIKECSTASSNENESDTLTSRRSNKSSASLMQLQHWLLEHKKVAFSAVASLMLVMLLLSVWSMIPSDDVIAAEQDIAEAGSIASKPVIAREITTLPDGFSLVLEDDVLIVRWLGETGSPTKLWSLATAKGDRACSALTFNNGTEYRTVAVDLLADTGTEARFSPLDTKAIIVDMARRGNVSLCGYNFSLKGSQAAIGKVAAFSTYL
ncbi:DUF805 domain-containing protein [Shewanella sp. GutCb]|uniref:DUF805 domain-containing protein n=1 Tax=Shewanella sp. GutCb TaxID=2058315 RepID=UPI000C7A1674|nr:DUF805 domain-containing protein [Shewanella sp. GutCb]PKG75410.1 DUF805 domain-containing protein [Shewanella sp. GutCb]